MLAASPAGAPLGAGDVVPPKDDRMAWWRNARFGMFDGSTAQFNPQTGGAGTPTGSTGVGGFLWSNPGAYFLIGELGPRWTTDGLAGHFEVGWFDQTGESVGPQVSAASITRST